MSELRFTRDSPDARLPVKGTPHSAAYDLYAAEPKTLAPRSRALITTGLKLAQCPHDVYLRIAPRSGLAVKGFDVGAGVVDADYRGPVKILFINTTDHPYTVQPGDRIAQLIPERIRTDLTCTIEGEESDIAVLRAERGEGGFGSTR